MLETSCRCSPSTTTTNVRGTLAGMQAALRAGRWPFQTPLGYIKKGERLSSRIEIDPGPGLLLLTAFEMYATGLHTMKDVLDHVTSLGLRSRKDKKINRQSFDRHLRNPFYAGWVSSPEWKMKERGAFEQLVSDEVFARVQALLDGRAVAITPHVRNHPDFPLRGFVRCGACDRSLTASWSKGRSKKYPYYFCPPAAKCNKSKMAKGALEEQFIVVLETLRPRPEYIQLFHEIVLDVWKERRATATAIGEAKQRRVSELHDKRSRLVDAFLEKVVSKAAFEAQQERLENDIAIAELEANEAKIDQLDIDAALTFAEYVLTNAARLWREANLDQKQRLQRVLFPKGAVLKDGKVSTAVTCSIYSWLQPADAENARLACRTRRLSNRHPLTPCRQS